MSNQIVRDGLVVALDYSLLVDGQMVDSSGESPLEYLQGYNNIIPGLERQLSGVALNQEKEFIVKPEDAYGQYNPGAVFQLEKEQFPPTMPLKIGYTFRVRTDSGRILNARIVGLHDEWVEVDTNHPLAGKELHFRAKIIGLREPTEEELLSGRVGRGCASCESTSSCAGSCN